MVDMIRRGNSRVDNHDDADGRRADVDSPDIYVQRSQPAVSAEVPRGDRPAYAAAELRDGTFVEAVGGVELRVTRLVGAIPYEKLCKCQCLPAFPTSDLGCLQLACVLASKLRLPDANEWNYAATHSN